MAISIADQYYLKGWDRFDYDWEATIENLNYALSHDPDHAGANHLMGRLFENEFKDYETAESYYLRALGSNPNHLRTCKDYAYLLITLYRHSEADKLLEHFSRIPGSDRSTYHLYKGLNQEFQRNYEAALEQFKEAIATAVNNSFIDDVKDDIKRVKAKMQSGEGVRYSYEE